MKLIYICGNIVCELPNDRIGGVKGGLRKFEMVISTVILAKNLNSKYMSQYIHYIAICSIMTHCANTYILICNHI